METDSDIALHDDPMRAIASPPPDIAVANVRAVLRDQYGLDGEMRMLVSERDQNWRVTADDGRRFVLKIANAAERAIVTDFQIQALLHIERAGCRVATPHIVRTLDGSPATTIKDNDVVHVCRVVSYLPGRLLEDTTINHRLAGQLGEYVAAIDVALSDFEHAGDSQSLLWDLQRAPELRPLLQHVPDTHLRDSISESLDEFEDSHLDWLSSLPRQVIHGDPHPGNVLISNDEEVSITGMIDFGDMVRAPVIIDLAIAAAYLRPNEGDPLAFIAALVAGYHSVSGLPHEHLMATYGLVRMRLATSITILHWRINARGDDDAYGQASMQGVHAAEKFFATLGEIGEPRFSERMLQATQPEL